MPPADPAPDWTYPPGTAAALLDGPLLTPATAAVLRARSAPPVGPGVFDAEALAVLAAVAARLIPDAAIDLAAALDRRLATGGGDGWRYADQPADAALFERGLRALGPDFAALDPGDQDARLRDVQAGRADWPGVDPARFFEELLTALVEIHYAQPATLDAIGYAGYADARGWQAVGIGARQAFEPKPR